MKDEFLVSDSHTRKKKIRVLLKGVEPMTSEGHRFDSFWEHASVTEWKIHLLLIFLKNELWEFQRHY